MRGNEEVHELARRGSRARGAGRWVSRSVPLGKALARHRPDGLRHYGGVREGSLRRPVLTHVRPRLGNSVVKEHLECRPDIGHDPRLIYPSLMRTTGETACQTLVWWL